MFDFDLLDGVGGFVEFVGGFRLEGEVLLDSFEPFLDLLLVFARRVVVVRSVRNEVVAGLSTLKAGNLRISSFSTPAGSSRLTVELGIVNLVAIFAKYWVAKYSICVNCWKEKGRRSWREKVFHRGGRL